MASFADRFRKSAPAGADAGESVPASGESHLGAGKTPPAKSPMIAKRGALGAEEMSSADAQADEQALLRKLGILPPEGVVRKLGETTPDVPYVFPSPRDSGYRKTLKAALAAEETQLGVWINPDDRSAEAWIAVQVQGDPNLLLLHRLPLLNRSAALQEPF